MYILTEYNSDNGYAVVGAYTNLKNLHEVLKTVSDDYEIVSYSELTKVFKDRNKWLWNEALTMFNSNAENSLVVTWVKPNKTNK